MNLARGLNVEGFHPSPDAFITSHSQENDMGLAGKRACGGI